MLGFISKVKSDQFRSMVDDMPVNVMTCRLNDFVIDYVNKSTVETLWNIEHVLPVKAANPWNLDRRLSQNRISARSSPIPAACLQGAITVGGEILDLLVTAIMDGRRYAAHAHLEPGHGKVRLENEQARLKQVIDDLPIAIITRDLDFKDQLYQPHQCADPARIATVSAGAGRQADRPVDRHLPQESAASAPLAGRPGNNLPHQAKIKVGPKPDLRVSATTDSGAVYRAASPGPSTATTRLAENVNNVAQTVSHAAARSQSGARLGTCQHAKARPLPPRPRN